MKEGNFNECEIINCLGDDKHNFLLLKEPETEIYYILVNGRYFAEFAAYTDALIVHDMLHLHFNNYLHIYED